MKKNIWILLLLLPIVFLSGCEKKQTKEDKLYKEYVSKAVQVKSSSALPFNVELKLEKSSEEEVSYTLIIDKPVSSIKDIKAVLVNTYSDKDAYPSIGIYDKTPSLIPNEYDESKNHMKGIILGGYLKYKEDIKDLKVTFKAVIDANVDGKDITYNYYKEYKTE
ncbi:MAG: hypothetical protein RSB41_04240 [Bacilli bacterium]